MPEVRSQIILDAPAERNLEENRGLHATRSLNIRTFKPSDIAAVRQLFIKGLLEFVQGTDLEDPCRSYIDRSLSDDLADIAANYQNQPGNNFWIADLAGQVKGMVGILKHSSEEAELRRMSVASDARRLGIGGKLLETIEGF